MKSNGLLKWLMIPMALAVLFVAIRLFSGHSAPSAGSQSTSQLTPEEMKALGIEGDTPRDTVATLVAQVKQLRNELQTALNDNTNAKAENDRLRARESTIDQRIQGAIDGERNHLREERDQVSTDHKQTQTLLQDLQKRLDGLSGKPGQSDLPVGLGLQDGDGKSFDSTRWVEPDDPRPDDRKGNGASAGTHAFATSFGPAQTTLTGPAADTAANSGTPSRNSGTPVYTVPANATLMGSVAMTALIGRVPIDGTVNDPYPFKVLIGPDNLTANGIDLPDVAGAVVSGTASGDWTLSCVRGQIRSVTFVFQDGTIRTMPEDRGDANGNTNTSNTASTGQNGNTNAIQGGLGWISDPYGIPCVAGERHSNAEQYLGSQLLITAAGAGAASLIPKGNNDYSFVSGANGSTIGTVGITGNQAMGRILAGGVQEMSQWVDKLYGQAFAAIYVPPGARVAVHIDHPLNIDYDPKGRRVNHRIGEAHASDLD